MGAVLAALLAAGAVAAPSGTTDFGPDGAGGYPVVEVVGVREPSVIRVVYATHPEGLGPKGDFWHETRATYLGPDVWLPILPANTDRYDDFRVISNGTYRAALAQGLVRYAKWTLLSGSAAVASVRLENRGIHSEEPVVGAFSCSDPRLTALWRASVRTCALSAVPARTAPLALRGAHTNAVLGVTYAYLSDGAKRDRLVWSGDLWWAQRNMYAAYPSDSPYMPGSIRMLADNRTPDGYIQACPYPESRGPLTTNDYGPFPSDEFAAWFVPVVRDHVLHTADLALAREVFPAVRDLVAYLARHTRSDGIFEQRLETCRHSCGLAVGGTSMHHRSYMNVLLWKTLRDAASLADWLGERTLAADWTARADRLAASVRACFRSPEGVWLRLSLEDPAFGFEANALALAAEFFTADEASAVLPLLVRHRHGKFQALAARGAFAYGASGKGMELLAAHNWYKLFDPAWQGLRTTQECMNLVTHGWGDEAHPDTALAGLITSCVLGVEPLAPGYREFRVRPNPSSTVTSASGRVPTPYGFIEVEWTLRGGRPEIVCRAPRECVRR